MKPPKIHLRRENALHDQTACGTVAMYLTEVILDVTCGSCLRTVQASGWPNLKVRCPSVSWGPPNKSNKRPMMIQTRALTSAEAEVFVDAVLEAIPSKWLLT